MGKNIDFMTPFRARTDATVYVLSIVMVKDNKRTEDIVEKIDAFEGEMGKSYARNLLIRMGNYVAFGTELEKEPWKEDDKYSKRDREEWGYIKSNENGDYILARAYYLSRGDKCSNAN